MCINISMFASNFTILIKSLKIVKINWDWGNLNFIQMYHCLKKKKDSEWQGYGLSANFYKNK